ncbi:hypothetical protein D3C72_501370 [compost metagenome]
MGLRVWYGQRIAQQMPVTVYHIAIGMGKPAAHQVAVVQRGIKVVVVNIVRAQLAADKVNRGRRSGIDRIIQYAVHKGTVLRKVGGKEIAQ